MSELSREQIIRGLAALGLPRGAILMLHSSLSSMGRVAGGADTVIDALLETIGPEGTLLMPTHPARDGEPFDPDTVPSDMGIVSETFRRRPGVLRSRHPYHPVAAIGARAEDMLRDHERSAVPDGPHTPYGRLIRWAGWVLHIGCDLDTLTLLHTVEAELKLPYLRELDMPYLDAQGQVQSLHIERCPGGHRGGVLKFDRLFRDEGAMAVGRIGRAVCRLLSAPEAAAIMRREMERDPCFALDDNPNCSDCVRFRGQVRAGRLATEEFRLSAPLWAFDGDLQHTLRQLQGQGISWVELDADHLEPDGAALDRQRSQLHDLGFRVAVVRSVLGSPATMVDLCAAAARLEATYLLVTALPRPLATHGELIGALRLLADAAGQQQMVALQANRSGSAVETIAELARVVNEVGSPSLGASYDPATIAQMGGSPFYGGLYKGALRQSLRHVDLRDIASRDGSTTLLGKGTAEIAEIISNLRCRSYDGFLCLWPLHGRGAEGFRAAARSFWTLLDNM